MGTDSSTTGATLTGTTGAKPAVCTFCCWQAEVRSANPAKVDAAIDGSRGKLSLRSDDAEFFTKYTLRRYACLVLPRRNLPSSLLSWTAVALLAALCGILGALEYRWTGEISAAERQRFQATLADRLRALAREFNTQISGACSALSPTARGHRSKDSYAALFRRVEVVPLAESVPWGEPPSADNPLVVDCPPAPLPMPLPVSPEDKRLRLEFDPAYLREKLLPDYVNRYLADSGKLDYDVEVVAALRPSEVIYASLLDATHPIGALADGEVSLLNPRPVIVRFGRPPFGRPPRPGPPMQEPPPPITIGGIRVAGPGPPIESGLWVLRVRHRAGSLEVLVRQVRLRNLAVASGLLLLILATALMLVRFSRRAQRLAELEMNFVAGVSHELRTPLTVIHTAAFNLRGKLAQQPEQVEKYGALIQRESAKLAGLVEQVLRFAGAGRVASKLEPIDVPSLVERSLPPEGETEGLTIDKQIPPELPAVMTDPEAAVLALRNLIENAVKHGTAGDGWIGIAASSVPSRDGFAVEISISDHGPGIPANELDHVFQPFFRGKHAIAEQIHGTGLGLSLVKKMVEAQGGSVRVESEAGRGAAFFIRLPAAAGPAIESA
jgi:signal transduction histidine kinase